MNTKILGRRGEELAERFLIERGYVILERNFKNKLGEIDLIARQGAHICFIEVKARAGHDVPQEAVNWVKKRKLTQVAQGYLLKVFHHVDVRCRFDVVAVDWADSTVPRIQLIVNAFEINT